MIRYYANGVEITNVAELSAEIEDILNDVPNTFRFTLIGTAYIPHEGNVITVTRDGTVEFAGNIVQVEESYFELRENLRYTVTCQDRMWSFNKKRVTARWANVSASTIATDIVTASGSSFTTTNIVGALATQTEFICVLERPADALKRLAAAIGGNYYIDYGNPLTSTPPDVHFFLTETTSPPDELNDTATFSPNLRLAGDIGQIRTRVRGIGGGTTLSDDIAISTAILPVGDGSFFESGGGQALADTNIITYTSRHLGGVASTVAGSVAAPSGSATGYTTANGGILAGTYLYKVAYADASGETPASASSLSATATAVAAPTLGSMSASGGATTTVICGLSVAASANYNYKVTYVTALGETAASSALGAVSSQLLCGNDGIPVQYVGTLTATGTGVLNGTYYYRLCYLTAFGETFLSPTSASVAPSSQKVTVDRGWATTIYWDDTSALPTGPTPIKVVIYRTKAGGSTFFKLVELTLSDGAYTDNTPDDSLGASKGTGTSLTDYTAGTLPIDLSVIPTGPTGTLARRIYRTLSGGTEYFLVGQISDNTTQTFRDTKRDSELLLYAPLVSTAGGQTITLTGIPTGPTGVTKRVLYRTIVGGSTDFFELGSINNNTSTSFADNVPDTSLGGLALTVGTMGAVPGASTLQLASVSGFATAGWALVDSQRISYTGITSTTLTGIPASGPGALLSSVKNGVSVVSQPFLSGCTGVTTAMKRDTGIRMYLVRNDSAAQTVLAAADGSDGVYEGVIDDSSILTLSGLTKACDAELTNYKSILRQITFTTRDTKVRSGKTLTLNLASPFGTFDPLAFDPLAFDPRLGLAAASGSFLIQRVVSSELNVASGVNPLRNVTASPVLISFQDVLRRAAL